MLPAHKAICSGDDQPPFSGNSPGIHCEARAAGKARRKRLAGSSRHDEFELDQGITETIPLNVPPAFSPAGQRITSSVIGVNPHPTKPVVYVGGFTSPSNQAVLAVIEW